MIDSNSHSMEFSKMMSESWNGVKDLKTDTKTLVLGSLFHILFFLIIPILLVFGYEVKVMRNASRGEDKMPTFSGWFELILMGIISSILAPIVYLLLPFLLLFGMMYGVYLVAFTGSFIAIMASLSFVLIVMIGLFLVLSYALPIGVAAYAHTGRISAMFEPDMILPVIKTMDYFLAYLVISMLVPIVTGLLITLLSITIVGIILIPTILFVEIVYIFRLIGLVYGKHIN